MGPENSGHPLVAYIDGDGQPVKIGQPLPEITMDYSAADAAEGMGNMAAAINDVTITKAYRAPDWWLKWTEADGLLCVAFFSTCLGKPLLAIEKKSSAGRRFPAWSTTWTPRI